VGCIRPRAGVSCNQFCVGALKSGDCAYRRPPVWRAVVRPARYFFLPAIPADSCSLIPRQRRQHVPPGLQTQKFILARFADSAVSRNLRSCSSSEARSRCLPDDISPGHHAQTESQVMSLPAPAHGNRGRRRELLSCRSHKTSAATASEAMALFTDDCKFSQGLPGRSPRRGTLRSWAAVLHRWHSCCSRLVDYQ
jgi:hypothetical protein